MLQKLEVSNITPEFIEKFNLVFDRAYNLDNTLELVSDPNYFIYLDTDGDKFVGFVYGYFLRGGQRSKWYTHLWTIQIVEKYQRKGLGTVYIDKVKEIGRERGCRAIFLITQDDEDTALQFYNKVGGRQINDGLDRVVWIMTDLE
jgi:ribosomal protein S18 acetylase RimI-like enzyme